MIVLLACQVSVSGDQGDDVRISHAYATVSVLVVCVSAFCWPSAPPPHLPS